MPRLYRRFFAADTILLATIALLATLRVSLPNSVPGAIPVAAMSAFLERYRPPPTRPAADLAAPDRYPRLGIAPIFTPLVPAPVCDLNALRPSHPRPISLHRAIASWKVVGIANGTVTLKDRNTREEWTMSPTDPNSRTRKATHGGRELDVTLDSINDKDFDATFSTPGAEGPQIFRKSIFDDDHP